MARGASQSGIAHRRGDRSGRRLADLAGTCAVLAARRPLTLAALAQNAIFGVRASDVVTRKAVVAAAAFMEADAIAAEIIKGCTGEVAFAEPVDELAKSYAAPREEISALFCGAWPT